MSLCISSRDGRASSCTRQQSEVGCGKVHRGGRCQWASPQLGSASSQLEKAAALEQKGREGGVGDEVGDEDEDMDEDVDEDVDEDGEGGDGDGDGHKDD